MLAGAAAMSLFAAVALVEVGPEAGVAIALVPLTAILAVLLVGRGRVVLYAAVFALPLSGIGLFYLPAVPLGGTKLFFQDLIVGIALGAWAFASLLGRRGDRAPKVPRTPVIGWPFVLFGAAITIAVLRGHYAYGSSFLGQGFRLIFYAGIVVALVGLTVGGLYRLLLGVFYTGTIVTMAWAVYYIATGTSQTDQVSLSTGGTRILSISTSHYCAGTLFLALLSLRLQPGGGARLLHLAMAALGLFGVVLGFGRAVFAATALVCLLLLVFSRPVRIALASVVPLALPFLALLAIFIPRVAPDAVDAFVQRVTASPTNNDTNVNFRVAANEAVFAQIREQPLIGVGFGRNSEIVFDYNIGNGVTVADSTVIPQDPHNGYVYLWATGGLAALAPFVLMLGAFAGDAIRRYRSNHDPTARLLVLWSSCSLFVWLVNAGAGSTFSVPTDLMAVWALLVTTSVVPYGGAIDVAGDTSRQTGWSKAAPAGGPGRREKLPRHTSWPS